MRNRNVTKCALIAFVFAASLTAIPTSARAENLIKQPGAHNRYSLELEPHLAAYVGGWRGWNQNYYRDEQVGPGIRFGIPLMHNGPIDTINNNIAISFGLQTFFPYEGNVLMSAPAAFQWNFYFTDIISVLGEVGLQTNIWTGPGRTFDLTPLVQGGGRFQFGTIGVIVRIGYPTVSVGANIQF